MPKVDGKSYPYTDEGMKDAKKAAKSSGKSMSYHNPGPEKDDVRRAAMNMLDRLPEIMDKEKVAGISISLMFNDPHKGKKNAQALVAKTVGTVGMAAAADIKSYNGPVDITLTFSSVGTTGVVYSVFVGADGTNFDVKATGNVTANETIVVEDVKAPYVGVYAQKIGTGTGSAICTVSGVREIYRNEMIERS
jgi:hypothetical protein